MAEKLQKLLNDSFVARWGALILIALMMFFAYMFVDVLSPLKSLIEGARGWDSGAFGTYAAGEYILNVCGFLIIAGIILDKMGIRYTGILSASLMVGGAIIKYIGVSDWFQVTGFCNWLNSWWVAMPGSAKMAAFGFMIFGCGCEMAGTTVSKAIAKWFKGKEMALAMGIEMAIARLGVFAVMWLSPKISNAFAANGMGSVVAPVAFCTALLLIGLICYIVFSVMDTRFDRQLVAAGLATDEKNPEDEFKAKDIGAVLGSKMFWIVALLCVLYYSAIFPFQRYATNYFEVTLNIEAAKAAELFSWFPILAMVLTPFLGIFLDFKGKGASMLMLGAIIQICCHLCFAFVLPIFPSKALALLLIVVLGVSFSLVPAALWPSVPKIIEEKVLGSAYCLIFWVQNVGLCFVPMLIGKVLTITSGEAFKNTLENSGSWISQVLLKTGDYTIPMIIFSSFGILAFIFSFLLRAEDRKKGFGLELPNIKR